MFYPKPFFRSNIRFGKLADLKVPSGIPAAVKYVVTHLTPQRNIIESLTFTGAQRAPYPAATSFQPIMVFH